MTISHVACTAAGDIAAAIKSKSASALEITRATLARIEKARPVLNCFITISSETALKDAAAIDDKIARGEDPGPLAGVPLHVKDLVNTKGVRTTFGSIIYEHNVPQTDSVSVARLRAAGAVLVGKTTTPEFGHMVWTEAPLFGRTRNAWDATRTSGGSSGGAAVACAAGLGPLAIATCAGGSTRIPAACNGVVGLKQSLGLVPHDMAPESFANLSYITPTTRTVHDTGLMLDVMSGPHPADVHSFGALLAARAQGIAPTFAEAALPHGKLEGLRVAWRPFVGNTVIDREVLRLTSDAAHTFQSFGARMEEMTDDMEPTEPMWLVISTALWNARFRDQLPQWRDRMSKTLLRQMEGGEGHTAEMLARASTQRTAIYRKIQSWFERFDLIVMPTLARTALPIDERLFEPIEIEGKKVDTVRKAWFPYTHPFNLSGNPAITLPAGFHSDGLPVAIQIVGRRGADALVLRAAALFESARPWAQHRPSIAGLDA
jgi:aspartyl-tRNA(Asn)/glutamyl-tRNA(Gln) amidotransferase subunit A